MDLPDPDGPSTATTHFSGRSESATVPPEGFSWQTNPPIVPGLGAIDEPGPVRYVTDR
ncbi:hypothetical protein Alo02nite_63030 [Actinoplanes lobatus]|uniref:Uncharacterized protein n=1 Tax=Actinoplanes lobatus TaxID=113568 RepID=A0ABQ4AQW6_9ACTN|nr:hypothetical protein Alo02nite_63030 [Actinoplanes lobatus]